MDINTNHLQQSIKTLETSFRLFNESLPESSEKEVFRLAIIKAFELCQEISFKLLRKCLLNFSYTPKQLDSTPVKELLRIASQKGVLPLEEVSRWFVYRDNRVNTNHDYDENFGIETLDLIPQFLLDVWALKNSMATQYSL